MIPLLACPCSAGGRHGRGSNRPALCLSDEQPKLGASSHGRSGPAPIRRAARELPVLTAGGIVLAIGGLYFGRDIFIPFALAILLSFALTPLVNWLRRLKLPRIAAVLIAVTLAFILIGGIGFVVGRQIVQLASNLPTYQTTITQKIRSLQQTAPGGGIVEKVTTTIEDLGKEISGEDKPVQKPGPRSAALRKSPSPSGWSLPGPARLR